MCDWGGKGTFTAVARQDLGYRNAATLKGGFSAWAGTGRPMANQRDAPPAHNGTHALTRKAAAGAYCRSSMGRWTQWAQKSDQRLMT
jgi:3-mercaptopyruvate sulfurtransferase SseA